MLHTARQTQRTHVGYVRNNCWHVYQQADVHTHTHTHSRRAAIMWSDWLESLMMKDALMEILRVNYWDPASKVEVEVLQKSFILFIVERIYLLRAQMFSSSILCSYDCWAQPWQTSVFDTLTLKHRVHEISEINITSLYQGSQIFLARSRVQKNECSENINILLFQLFVSFSWG